MEATTFHCPKCLRCGTAMKGLDVAGTPLDECPQCGGMWLGVAAFEHVCSDPAAQKAAADLPLPPAQPTNSQDGPARYLGCPQCSKLMNRSKYSGGSGLLVHVCHDHGNWLDRDA